MMKVLVTGLNGDSTFQTENGTWTVIILGSINETPGRYGVLLSVDGTNFHETVLVGKEVDNHRRKLLIYDQFVKKLFRLELVESLHLDCEADASRVNAVLLDELVLHRIATQAECICLPAIYGPALRSGDPIVLNA